MKTLSITLIAAGILQIACSPEPVSEPQKTSQKPDHVFSTQVEALYQAQEVLKYTQEQQALNERRLQELGIGDPNKE